MENRKNPMAELWGPTLENIFNDKNLPEQVEQVRDIYPELAAAFDLLTAYIGFVQEPLEMLRTIPEIDPSSIPVVFQLPAWFCDRAPLICGCANGDTKACQALDRLPARTYIPKTLVPKI